MEKDVKMRIGQHVGRCATRGLAPSLTASLATTLRRSQKRGRRSRSRQVEEVTPAGTKRDRQESTTSRQAGPTGAREAADGAQGKAEDEVAAKEKIKEKVKGPREAKAKRAKARNKQKAIRPESPVLSSPISCAMTSRPGGRVSGGVLVTSPTTATTSMSTATLNRKRALQHAQAELAVPNGSNRQ